MSPDREYLRAVDIARLTGVSLRTVRRSIADEILPSRKIGGARLGASAELKLRLSACRDGIPELAVCIEEANVSGYRPNIGKAPAKKSFPLFCDRLPE